ncbi:MAG: SAM-dependent methyltransferase [Bacteroidota bacterium]
MESIIKGKLYLLPSGLGNEEPINFLPNSTLNNLMDAKHFIVEEIKTARRFLRKIGYKQNFDDCFFCGIGKHANDNISEFLKITQKGNNIFLMSEAGVPGVADPGGLAVSLAHQQNIKVVPLTGPSSILMSLMASGLNGQYFCFNGYVPIDKVERVKKIKSMALLASKENQTQIFIEAPFRNNQLLKDIIENTSDEIKLCIAMEITNEEEFIETKSIKSWKKHIPELHKKMCVFLLGK